MAKSLPPRPNLEQLKKQAKSLLRLHKQGDKACCTALRALPQFHEGSDEEILAADVSLVKVQHALVLGYGFKSWRDLKSHITRQEALLCVEHELSEITRVRVTPITKHHRGLMLTDSEGRSLWMSSTPVALDAMESWEKRGGFRVATDAYQIAGLALDRFGLRIKRAEIREHKAVRYLTTLVIQTPEGIAEVECQRGDAIGWAMRVGAPVFIADDVMKSHMLRRKDGQPLSPAGAWRRMLKTAKESARRQHRRFATIQGALKALEKNPKDMDVRRAVRWATVESRRTRSPHPCSVRDTSDALSLLEAWVGKCEGTSLEGTAAGLLGAVYLYGRDSGGGDRVADRRQMEKAIACLERAHRCCPESSAIAFDLATAYARAGQRQKAFAILEKGDVVVKRNAREFGNLKDLWSDPRFVSLVGEPDSSCENLTFQAQLLNIVPVPISGRQNASRLGPPASELPSPRQSMRRELQASLECGPLVAVRSAMAAQRGRDPQGRGSLTMTVEGGRRVVLQVRKGEADILAETTQMVRGCHHGFAETACHLLRKEGIRIEAAALVKGRGRAVKSALLLTRGDDRCTISADGLMPLAVGFAAKSPVLVSEVLAQKVWSDAAIRARCEVCGKEATVHITEMHRGKAKVRHFCEDHAAQTKT